MRKDVRLGNSTGSRSMSEYSEIWLPAKLTVSRVGKDIDASRSRACMPFPCKERVVMLGKRENMVGNKDMLVILLLSSANVDREEHCCCWWSSGSRKELRSFDDST